MILNHDDPHGAFTNMAQHTGTVKTLSMKWFGFDITPQH